MTPIEQVTFQNGFRIALVAADVIPAGGTWRYAWRLYDGGRCIDRADQAASYSSPPPEFIGDLRALFLKVIAPPHVIALLGRGHVELLSQTLIPALVAECRILDLLQTSLLLAARPIDGRDLDACLQAYGVSGVHQEDTLLDDRHENLLWQILARAGKRGLNWQELLSLAQQSAPTPLFDGYAFNETTIATLPKRPGVYVMHDRDDAVLYVGKSGNLARRLAEYFRLEKDPSEKITAIRDQIHRFTYKEVGSELEALLLENRWIEDLNPRLNVQRTVAEGRGKYGSPAGPVMLMLPSKASGAVELFFLGGPEPRTVQVRVNLAKPPRATISSICDWLNGRQQKLRRSRAVREWGSGGNEISERFLASRKKRLHWCQLPSGSTDDAYIDKLLEVITRAVDTGFDPAEIRF